MTGPELVSRHPDCACENTEPHSGGHGPVRNNEHLVFFIESPQHADMKKAGQRGRRWTPKARDLRNITTGRGHSVYRREHATSSELRMGARKGYDHCTSRREDGTGGIVGIFEITTASIRSVDGKDGRTCVVDTPVVHEEDEQLAHADLLWSNASDGPDEALLLKRLAFEDKLARSMEREGSTHAIPKFPDADLCEYLPEVVRTNPDDYPLIMTGEVPEAG